MQITPRSAVIAALQDLALQVVHQLADRVEELHPITSSETGEASSSDADSEASESTSVRRKRRHPSKPRLFAPRRVEPLRIELANRMANNSTPTRRTIAFPRRGRATSSTSGFASAELACLLRLISLIVANLRAKGAAQTKRDLYYADVRLFKSQRTVDSLVDDLAATLGCRRFDLGIVASAKGLMHGALQIRCTGGQIVDAADSTQLIPPKETIDELAYEGCHLVLVVEKEAMFQTLKESLPELGQGVLLICGKGQPDVATRELVCSLAERLDSK